MAEKVLIFLISAVSTVVLVFGDSPRCIKENPCMCRFKDGKKIDLNPLQNETEFISDTRQFPEQEITYYFHGCSDLPFDAKRYNINATTNECNRPLSVCMHNKTGNVSSLIYLGSVADSEFEDTHFTEKLILKPNNKTTVTIVLVCTTMSANFLKVTALPENGVHQLYLFTPLACPFEEKRGLSAGTVFLLIFAFSFLTYFFGGMILLRLQRSAQGLEMIPNLQFWMGLPSLVKDGAVFLLSGCRPTVVVTSAEAYERI